MSQKVATEVSCLKPHGDSIVCAVFAPHSDVLCTGSNDMMVHLWRVSDGWTCRLRGHTNWVTCVAVQPSGILLASGSADETLRLWDLTSLLEAPDGQDVQESDCTLKNYGGAIRCCDWSKSGELLCSGAADTTIRVWRMGARSCDLIMVLRGHKGWVMGCSFSPTDETMLASASSDGTVRLWRANSGDCIKKMKGQKRRLGQKSREVLCCKFHPSGDLVCAGGDDKILRLWRVHDGGCVQEFEGHKGSVRGCDFQPGGGRLLASCGGNSLGNSLFGIDNSLRLWDLAGDQVVSFEPMKGHKRKVNACAFNNDGSLVATVSNDNSVRIWSLQKDLHPPEDLVGIRKVETAISERHSRAPSLYNGSDDSTTSVRSHSISVSNTESSERGARETDSGAGVFGAMSARTTDTHSTPRQTRGHVSPAGGSGRGDDAPATRAPSAGAHGSMHGSAEGAGAGEGNLNKSSDTDASGGGSKDGLIISSSGGASGAPFVRRQSDQELASARLGPQSDGVGGGRSQWVQLRKPWRVEARLLEMDRGVKVVNQNHLVAEGLDAGAQMNPVHTRSQAVDDSGEVTTFEIHADFGMMEQWKPPGSLKKIEPRSNHGIEMVVVDEATGEKLRPPISGRMWSGKLNPTPKQAPQNSLAIETGEV